MRVKHNDTLCPLLEHRVACNECGYSYSEALYGSWEEMKKEEEKYNNGEKS